MSVANKLATIRQIAKANEIIRLQGEVALINNCLKQIVKNVCQCATATVIYKKSDKPSFTINIDGVADKNDRPKIMSAINGILKSPKIKIEETDSGSKEKQTIKITATVSCMESVLEKNAANIVREFTKNNKNNTVGGWLEL